MSGTAPSFPLIDRSWILVLDRDGRVRAVSLRQALAEAHDLRALAGDLPTQVFAILRLLLAILHRSVDGPADQAEWQALWQSPRLPTKDIDAYLDEFAHRFDLLHPVTPFYQVADLHTAKNEVFGLERILADVPTGAPYLTTRAGPGLERISYAEGARWLVHCQAYDVSGIKSGAVGDPRVKGGKGYPQGPGSCGSLGGLFLEGRTLRETLLLNLVPESTAYLDHDPRDLPAWERPPVGAAEEDSATRGPFGRLGAYTWQSRRVRLAHDGQGITGALVAYGDKLVWDNQHRTEAMTGWRRNATREKEAKRTVYTPATHDPARALWRGLDAILPRATPAGGSEAPLRRAPALTEWLAQAHIDGLIEADLRVTMHAVGVSYGTQQSVIDEVYDDAVTVSVQAFEATGGLRTLITDATADAEAAVKALRALAINLCRAAGGSGNDAKDPPIAAGNRAAEQGFAALDQQFRAWLARLDPQADRTVARTVWQQVVRRTVTGLGQTLVNHAGPAAWAGRYIDPDQTRYVSSSLAEVWFRRTLRKDLPLAVSQTPVSSTNSPDPAPAESFDSQEVPV